MKIEGIVIEVKENDANIVFKTENGDEYFGTLEADVLAKHNIHQGEGFYFEVDENNDFVNFRRYSKELTKEEQIQIYDELFEEFKDIDFE